MSAYRSLSDQQTLISTTDPRAVRISELYIHLTRLFALTIFVSVEQQ